LSTSRKSIKRREMKKKIISGKTAEHEKLLIKAIKESSGQRQKAPCRETHPFPPSFASFCK
jgi:ribosomal protein S24E